MDWDQNERHTKRQQNNSSHLVHLQVGVRRPHLVIQGIMGISSVVFQTTTLLQVGLELLSAPPKEKEIKHKWNLFQEHFDHCQLDPV